MERRSPNPDRLPRTGARFLSSRGRSEIIPIEVAFATALGKRPAGRRSVYLFGYLSVRQIKKFFVDHSPLDHNHTIEE